MQRILVKRVWRDLKANVFRYLALGFLIILGMYLIISIVGAADTIMIGSDKIAIENHVEDGEFGVFVPLSSEQTNELEEKGITLEKMFYVDFQMVDKSTLRVYKNRENINLVELDEGELPQKTHEVALEKRYCQEHEIVLGDTIQLAGDSYQVTGIGSAPDYDAPYKSLSDSTVDSATFGIAFVNADAYDRLQVSGSSAKSEEYQYAYLLNGKMTYDELKEKLQKYEIDADQIDDPYFTEYWNQTAGQIEEMQDGIQKLYGGSGELSNGLAELVDHNENLTEGSAQIFDTFLKQANDALKDYGMAQPLTEDNYGKVLREIKEKSGNAILGLKLNSVIEQLDALKAYKDGIGAYTDGVTDAADGARNLADGIMDLKDGTEDFLEEYDLGLSNLTQFMSAEDNPRIGAAAADQVINKWAGLIAGIIVMVLFTYVISVFVVHGIEKESSIIGTLYALGAKKGDLLLHYLMLPVTVTFAAGLIGSLIGFGRYGVNMQMQDCYGYFSIPQMPVVHSLYLTIYGIVMPPLAAAIVNLVVIQRKLSQPALKLIRNEQKTSKISNINLGNMGFIGRFRIRQMLREARSAFAVIFGMFISLWILMMGLDCYVMCVHISEDNKADTKYEYMYTYKYPDETVPEDGEACFAKTLKKEIYGYNLDVTVLGIDDYNPYFDAKVSDGKNEVVISSAMAEKYGLKAGDKIVLSDDEENMDYAFEVTGTAQCSTAFYAFMDIDSMRELFGEDDSYYNVVLADHELPIDSGKLYAVTSKADIEKSSDVFISMMKPMVWMLIVVSVLIFTIVMYLMMKVMIDRSAFNISLIKIFGYRSREVGKLYLNGNFYIVAVGAAICIPLAKFAMDTMYPICISNISCGMNLTFDWKIYVGIYLAILALYFVINKLLVHRLKRMVPAEVLKNRE